MAAPGRHVGHCLQKNGQFLLNNIDKLWFRRGFHWTSLLHQQTAEATTESTESIVLPKRKTWSKVAVLEALALTVNRDPTASRYQFQDDSYLSPRTSTDFSLFLLAQEAGRDAAKYIINSNPEFFSTDFAEPHIPCLMPESVTATLEEVSEAALKERLSLRRVTEAVDMFDQLLQSGVTVSMETTHDLLDLISFYCDRNPVQKGPAEQDNAEETGEEKEEKKIPRARFRKAPEVFKASWKENNNAERIFNLLPERDTRCYSALIRGMVKHGAHAKAFSFYTDLLNNRLTGDVHMFNALIVAAADARETSNERWDLVTELLNQMKQQKVQPTLLTFNSVLKTLRRCGVLGKSYSTQTLSEMNALGIALSLASYNHVLNIFRGKVNLLQDVMSTIEGTRFSCQDPSDVNFFSYAMKVCLDNKDLELGYRVNALVEFGENWKLLGDPYQQSIYYGRFFNLLCMMEHVDVVLKWYRKLIPSLYYPNTRGLRDLLQALDTDRRLDMLPAIWKDICSLGHDNKKELVEELLGLMSRDRRIPEVQRSFSEVALEVKALLQDPRVMSVDWSAEALSNITALLLRADNTQHAWEMLQVFESRKRIPTAWLMEELLSSCISSGSSDRAVELVQTSAAFCLSCTSRLAEKAVEELRLSEEQRSILSELESAAEPSE